MAPNTPVTRNDGRKASMGFALQAEPKIYTPPTNFVRLTGGGDLLPAWLERQSQAFRGTAFETPADYAGQDWMGKNPTGEATIDDVALFLEHMYGAPDGTTKIITPQDATQWDTNFVMRPLSGQIRIPGLGYVKVRDIQTRELTLTVPESRTDFVSWSAQMDAASSDYRADGALGDFVPVAPIIPSYNGGLGRLDHSFTLAGQAYCPDGTSTARFYNPVEALPACGEEIPGFAPGQDPIGVEFSTTFNRPMGTLIDASKTKAFLDYTWKLERAGKLIEVTARVQVSAREIPVGAGRVRTTATFRARAETPGVSPFTVKVQTA